MSVQQRTGRPNQRFNNNRFSNNPNPGSNFAKKRFKPQGQFTNNNGQNNKQRREAIIARNLQHMQQIAEKKRVAQELYYGNGRSPMVKTSSGNFIRQNMRVSVQDRLGNAANTTINRINRSAPVINRNNIVANNRPKFINRNVPNAGKQLKFVNRRNGVAVNTMRSDKMMRMQSFQQKKIIRNNMNTNNINSHNNNNTKGLIRTVGSNGAVLFLRPTKGVPVRKNIRNTNLSISVPNDGRHHIKQNLNPTLQEEIKMIQAKSHEQIVQPQLVYNSIDAAAYSSNVNRLAITATKKTMNERFSSI